MIIRPFHTDVPHSPQNLTARVTEYHNFSVDIEISWNPPLSSNPQVSYFEIYYQQPYVNDNFSNSNLNGTEVIVYNTSNTSATIHDVTYNYNMSVTLSAHNCIGESAPAIYNFNIGR